MGPVHGVSPVPIRISDNQQNGSMREWKEGPVLIARMQPLFRREFGLGVGNQLLSFFCPVSLCLFRGSRRAFKIIGDQENDIPILGLTDCGSSVRKD